MLLLSLLLVRVQCFSCVQRPPVSLPVLSNNYCPTLPLLPPRRVAIPL